MATGKGRNTITQRIALEGGQEIVAQFKALGEAGAKAFDGLEKAAAAASSNLGKNFLTAIRSLQAGLEGRLTNISNASKQVVSSFGNMGTAIGATSVRLAALTGAAGGAYAAILLLAKGGAQAANDAGQMAERLQISVQAFTRLQYAASQFGVEGNQLENVFNKLNKELEEIRVKGQGADNVLTRLGVSAFNGNQLKKADELFADIAERFTEIRDGATKAAFAQELFGERVGTKLLPLLNRGADGIRAMGLEAQRLGLVFNKQEAIIGRNYTQALTRLQGAIEGTRNKIGLLFAPVATAGADFLTRFIVENQAKLLEFSATIRDSVLRALGQLMTFLKSKDAAVLLTSIKEQAVAAGQAVGTAFNSVIIPAFKSFMAVLDTIAKSLNGLFGTQLTGNALLATLIIAKLAGVFGILGSAIRVVVAGVTLLVATFGLVPVLLAAIGVAIGYFGAQAIVAGAQIAAALGKQLWESLKTAATDFVTFLKALFTGIGEFFKGIWDGIKSTASALWEGFKALALLAVSSVVATFAEGFTKIKTFFTDLLSTATSVFNSIVNFLKEIVSRATAAKAAVAGTGDRTASAPALAGGGSVRGPGTGTSDSILSWLSNGEFVIRAAAVKKFGAPFFAALNGLRMPGGFNAGGIVRGLGSAMSNLNPSFDIPAFADGGIVASGANGRPLTLVMPDGQQIEGLTATDDAADKLTRYALDRQARRSGKTPTWF